MSISRSGVVADPHNEQLGARRDDGRRNRAIRDAHLRVDRTVAIIDHKKVPHRLELHLTEAEGHLIESGHDRVEVSA